MLLLVLCNHECVSRHNTRKQYICTLASVSYTIATCVVLYKTERGKTLTRHDYDNLKLLIASLSLLFINIFNDFHLSKLMDLQQSDVGFERSTFLKPFAEGLEKKCNLVSFFVSFSCLVRPSCTFF